MSPYIIVSGEHPVYVSREIHTSVQRKLSCRSRQFEVHRPT